MTKQKLILVRGLPGSGKSSIAKLFEDIGYVHLETDKYFYDSEGNYKFDYDKLKVFHLKCREECIKYLSQGNDVVVSNTFTTKVELQPYFQIASEFNIIPNVILVQNEFESIHDVPCETIEIFKSRFNYNISDLFKIVE